MRIFLYALAGLAVGFALSFGVVAVNPTRFLFDNDILGLGPAFVIMSGSALGLIVGFVLGIRSQLKFWRQKQVAVGRRLIGVIGGIIGIILVTNILFPVFNPLALLSYPFRAMYGSAKTSAAKQQAETKGLAWDKGSHVAGVGFDSTVRQILLGPDDSIFVQPEYYNSSVSYNGTHLGKMARIAADGTVDAAFSSNLNATLSRLGDTGNAYVWQVYGTAASGSRFIQFNEYLFLVKTNGTLDPAFLPLKDKVQLVKIEEGGRSVFLGRQFYQSDSTRPPVERLMLDGQPDGNFRTGLEPGEERKNRYHVYNLATFGDGSSFAGIDQQFYEGEEMRHIFRLVVFGPDGTPVWQQERGGGLRERLHVHTAGSDRLILSLEEDVDNPGFIELSPTGPTAADLGAQLSSFSLKSVKGAVYDGCGGYLLIGYFSKGQGRSATVIPVVRIRATGILDQGFVDNAQNHSLGTVFIGDNPQAALDSKKRIFVSGMSPTVFVFASNGLFDGELSKKISSQIRGRVDTIAVDSQDRLIVGGRFNTASKPAHVNLVRFLPDGTVDPSFPQPLDKSAVLPAKPPTYDERMEAEKKRRKELSRQAEEMLSGKAQRRETLDSLD